MNGLSANPHAQSIDQTARPRLPSSYASPDEVRVRLPSDRFTAHLDQALTRGEWLAAQA